MTALKIDLHTHLKIAKRTPLRPGEVRRFVASARARGLHALACTEHFHAHGFWALYDELCSEFPYKKGRFEADGLLLFPGAELRLAEGADAVLIAPLEALRAIDEAFANPLSEGYFPSADELTHVLKRIGSPAIRILAHPFRAGRGLDVLDPGVAREAFDAAEINARFCDDLTLARTWDFAADAGLPVVGGSDAHVALQVGAAWTEITLWSSRAEGAKPDAGHALCEPKADAARRERPGEPTAGMAPDISFDDLRAALLAPSRSLALSRIVSPALHPDAETICREGAERKAFLKASLPRIEVYATSPVSPSLRHAGAQAVGA